MSHSRILKIIFVVIILAAIFWGSKTVENYLQDVIGSIASYMDGGGWRSVVIFVTLAALSVMLVSFSSIWLVPVALALWGNLPTLVMLLAGWFLGGIFSYLIGKYAGEPMIRKIISEEKINHYRSVFSRARGSFSFIILSRLALPSEIPGYLLGAAQYPFFKYLLATAIAEIPYAFAAVYLIDAVLRKSAIALLIWGAIWAISALFMIRRYKQITSHARPEV
ncbi:MAG: VTT domain-containing protein [Candidatus Sungiibacteriota bacterium]